MPLRKLFLTAQAVNPRFSLDVPIFEEESIADNININIFLSSLRFRCQMTSCSIFGVRCLSWLVMTFIKDKVRYGLMASLSISALQRQSHIYLPPLPQSFVCNLPDSWRHVTGPNQVLSTGRWENLRTRLKLVWPPVKKARVVPSSFRFSFWPCSPFTLRPTSRLKFPLENIKQLI